MESAESKNIGAFQIAILVLSVYALIALLVDTVMELDPEVSALIQVFDLLVCIFFFLDFLHQLMHAETKLSYLKWGWIDLMASIPMVDVFRWGRVVRILRIIRLIRVFRASHKLFKLFGSPASLSGSVILTAFMLIVFCSLAILIFEKTPESNIKTAGDALWWSFTTITTVGYGDRYPVTSEGRIVAVILMIGGVGLFGSFAAVVAAYLTGKRDTEEDQVLREIKALRAKIEEFEKPKSRSCSTDHEQSDL